RAGPRPFVHHSPIPTPSNINNSPKANFSKTTKRTTSSHSNSVATHVPTLTSGPNPGLANVAPTLRTSTKTITISSSAPTNSPSETPNRSWPVSGSPARMVDIVIVGEAWGVDELKQQAPFVGYSGHELTHMLAEAGISRTECYLTNVFNLHPPG